MRDLCRTAVSVMLVMSSLPAQAQDIGAGEDIARRHCSGCHQIGEHPKAFGFARAFAKIAAAKGTTQISIEVFLSTPHETMPNYVMSRKDIRDVAAYIISLSRPHASAADFRQ